MVSTSSQKVDVQSPPPEGSVHQPYKYGFVTNVETDSIPEGLDESVVEAIWAKKGEPGWMLDFRLAAFRHW